MFHFSCPWGYNCIRKCLELKKRHKAKGASCKILSKVCMHATIIWSCFGWKLCQSYASKIGIRHVNNVFMKFIDDMHRIKNISGMTPNYKIKKELLSSWEKFPSKKIKIENKIRNPISTYLKKYTLLKILLILIDFNIQVVN